MNESSENIQIDINNILNSASDLTDSKVSYVNHVRFNISLNEVTFDMYVLGPDPGGPLNLPRAHRTHRIVMPIPIAKELAGLILQHVARWEDMVGVNLPYPMSEESGVENESEKKTT